MKQILIPLDDDDYDLLIEVKKKKNLTWRKLLLSISGNEGKGGIDSSKLELERGRKMNSRLENNREMVKDIVLKSRWATKNRWKIKKLIDGVTFVDGRTIEFPPYGRSTTKDGRGYVMRFFPRKEGYILSGWHHIPGTKPCTGFCVNRRCFHTDLAEHIMSAIRSVK